jgi:hypothetical protein
MGENQYLASRSILGAHLHECYAAGIAAESQTEANKVALKIASS